MKTLVMTGGGTAGHIMPCLALLPELRKYFDRIIFVGGEGMEKEIVPKVMPFYSVPTTKLYRRHVYKNVTVPFILSRGVSAAVKILRQEGASVVFSKGGYASLPACLAAKKLSVPVVVHESDYTLGVANKLVSRFAALTMTSFIETKGGVCVGNPVREEILSGNAERAKTKYDVGEKPILLVVGGSSGAMAINDAIHRGLDDLLEKYDVVHVCGKKGDASVRKKGYVPLPYAEDIADLYAASDVVVSRGGSNALSELAALGKKSVIIPLPKGESRGDQVLNAESYRRKGFFTVLPQEELCVETLLDAVEKTLKKPQKKSDVVGTNEVIARKIASVMRV